MQRHGIRHISAFPRHPPPNPTQLCTRDLDAWHPLPPTNPLKSPHTPLLTAAARVGRLLLLRWHEGCVYRQCITVPPPLLQPS